MQINFFISSENFHNLTILTNYCLMYNIAHNVEYSGKYKY